MTSRAAWTLILIAAAAPAHADDWPARKPGLWEITTTTSSGKRPPTTHKLCLDRETEQLMYRQGAAMGTNCKTLEVHGSAQKVTTRAVCAVGQSQLTSSGVITFTGDTAFHADHQGRFEPPMAGVGETHTTQDGHWVGACPADMRPGDMLMKTPRGDLRVNLRDMLAR